MISRATIRKSLERLWEVTTVRNGIRRRLSRDGVFFLRFQNDHTIAYDSAEFIGQAIEDLGNFDRAMTEEVLRYCRESGAFIGRSMLVEIGANIGTQTIYLTRGDDFQRVVVVEPDPRNIQLLRANIALNSINAIILELAVGDVESVIEMHRHPLNSGMSSLRTIDRPGAHVSSDLWTDVPTLQVPVRRMDEVLSEAKIDTSKVGLFWVDVEGFELNALRGMHNSLRDASALFIEYTPKWLTEDDQKEFFEILTANFKRLLVYEGGIKEVSEVELAAMREQVNILALSK